jgi:hypothetical protein
MKRLVLACGALVLGVLAREGRAEACGGFFCQSVPVDQSGEHLLFGIEDDGTVVAHIQIQYQGAAESFAWVLPLPAEPEITIGSDEVFRTLRGLTDPTFELNWSTEGVCEPSHDRLPGGGADAAVGGEGEGEGEDGVTVLSLGPVGPYETAVLASDDAQALLTWLGDNQYVIPELSLPEIASYVNAGYLFLALRLQKDRSVGDLAPVVLRLPEDGPCIPLRLTAIAAMVDMPIYAWVLADGRAVSTNFLDVEPNWAAVSWISGGYNYEDVVRRAVDEATGHSFVTEYAGGSTILDQAFWFEGRYDLDALRTLDDPIAFLAELIAQGFSANSQLLSLLEQFIPEPDELVDVSEQDFYNCLECYADALVGMEFDPEGFAGAIQTVIIDPLVAAQELAARHPYLTRLHTTISPDEMTEDPLFRFNLDLGEVSNRHVADAVRLCQPDKREWEVPVRLTLPDGRVLFVEPSDADPSELTDMPASERASQLSESGPGEVLYENGDAIAGAIDAHFAEPPSAGGPVGGGVCSAAGAEARRGWLALFAGALAALARRRRS